MANSIHDLIDKIEPPRSDDRIQPAKNKSSDEEEYRAVNWALLTYRRL